MSEPSAMSPSLTRNQTLVMAALSRADIPLSAYTILDELRDQGFRAPPQVYRALEKLVELGLVHRVESLNAFVACRQPDCETYPTTVFAICDACGHVAEVSGDTLSRHFKAVAKTADFRLRKTTVELSGICTNCSET